MLQGSRGESDEAGESGRSGEEGREAGRHPAGWALEDMEWR